MEYSGTGRPPVAVSAAGNKPCSKCKEYKPIECFYRDRSTSSGYSPHCIDCRNSVIRNKPETRRKYLFKHRYGIDLNEYSRLFEQQNGRCGICADVQEAPLSVDHDHDTGEVRGLLCTKCNLMVGLAADSSARLLMAAAYLAKCGK